MVPVPVDRAFHFFTEELNTWWPSEYTWSGEMLETIEIELRENGRCFERGPHGFECDWGRSCLATTRSARIYLTDCS